MVVKILLNDTSTLDGGGQEESLRDAASVGRRGMGPARTPINEPVAKAGALGSLDDLVP
jgi:hypothetical protein